MATGVPNLLDLASMSSWVYGLDGLFVTGNEAH